MRKLITLPDPDGGGALTSPTTSYTYDAASRLSTVTDFLGGVTTYGYDALGRTTSVTDDLDQVTSYAYDAGHRLTSVTDDDANVTSFAYDRLGRTLSETNAEGGVVSFRYDRVGNLLSIKDPVGNRTRYSYDNLDRLIRDINPLDAVRSYSYDAASNLVERKDRNGRVTQWTYDGLDRAIEENWLDGSSSVIYTANFTFDAASQLLTAGDDDSDYAFGYDGLGRVTSIDNGGSPNMPHVILTQAFDAVGNRTSLSAEIDGNDDFVNAYTYDGLDRMTQVTQDSQVGGNAVDDKRVDFTYNQAGQFATIARFSDLAGLNEVITSTYQYDTLGRLLELDHEHASTSVAAYTWTYDSLNRLSSFTSADGAATYAYDDTDQLVGVDNTTLTDESYTYDENGNRVSTGYEVGKNNRLLSDGTYAYEYDAEGNRIKRTNISTGAYEAYAWDHHNRLTSVVTQDSGGTVLEEVTFVYDVFDRRITKTVDADGAGAGTSVSEHFVYDGDQIALAFDGAGSLTNRYLYGPAVDQILADEQLASGLFDQTIWPLADHLGSLRDLASDAGVVVNHRVYDSFGNLLSETNSTYNHRFAYTGRDWDLEIDLQFNRARYYDPRIGQWLGEDPIGFSAGDANLRRYVGNSATNATDPSGKISMVGQIQCYIDSTMIPQLEKILKGLVRFGELVEGNASDASNEAAAKELQADIHQYGEDYIGLMERVRNVYGQWEGSSWLPWTYVDMDFEGLQAQLNRVPVRIGDLLLFDESQYGRMSEVRKQTLSILNSLTGAADTTAVVLETIDRVDRVAGVAAGAYGVAKEGAKYAGKEAIKFIAKEIAKRQGLNIAENLAYALNKFGYASDDVLDGIHKLQAIQLVWRANAAATGQLGCVRKLDFLQTALAC